MKDLLDRVLSLAVERPQAIRAFAMSTLLGTFLLEVISCARADTGRRAARSLRPVLDYVDAHVGSPLALPELAARAGLSVSRFQARFKEEMGVPPGEYILRARVREAERRLAAGRQSVTRVAMDLGFSSSQYFATVYKRFTGRRPSEALAGGNS